MLYIPCKRPLPRGYTSTAERIIKDTSNALAILEYYMFNKNVDHCDININHMIQSTTFLWFLKCHTRHACKYEFVKKNKKQKKTKTKTNKQTKNEDYFFNKTAEKYRTNDLTNNSLIKGTVQYDTTLKQSYGEFRLHWYFVYRCLSRKGQD